MDVTTYTQNMLQHLGFDEESTSVAVQESDETTTVQIDVPQEDVGMMIGHKGETIAALQRMIRIVFREEYEDKKLTVNVNNYREERLDQLREKAVQAARKVLETGEEYVFPFYSSYERYIIHEAISSNPDFLTLESHSEGEGRDRRLHVRVSSNQMTSIENNEVLDQNTQPQSDTEIDRESNE